MSNCNEYIEKIYTSTIINTFINKIEPEHLQSDLRQEMALALLTYDCNKLIELNEQNKLIDFAKGIIWKLGVLPNSKFYKVYRKNFDEKNFDYLKSLQGNEINYHSVKIAETILNKKLNDNPNSSHEAMIFKKYVELRSCVKVAEFFGVPKKHIFDVVARVKKELKKSINK
jgi:hypothetical protein